MKVYGGNFFVGNKQVRGIIAGTQKQAASAINSSVNYIRQYWGATGNKKELEIALAEPGVLFWTENKHSSNREYKKYEGK